MSHLEVLLGADPEARWSGASSSQGLLQQCLVGKQKERVCVCKNVNVQEAQSKAFLFIVAVCRVRKSPADTHTHSHTHSSTSSQQNYMRGIHASVNRQFQTLTILHPVKFLL